MKNQHTKIIASSIAGALLTSMSAHADTFNGDGDGSSWEDPDNWLLDAVPTNGSSGNTFINGGHDMVFDSDTWTALATAGNLQSSTQYRVVRFLINESTGAGSIGANSLTFDFGDGRQVLQTNSTSSIWGGRSGSDTVLNIVSGELNTGSRAQFGARVGAMGTVNITGGTFNVGRSNLLLGVGTDTTTVNGVGILNISGGAFRTREGVAIGSTSTFHVAGSAPTQVGVGSQGSVDGFWVQNAGGVLRTGVDAGGTATILIDDVGDDGAGTQGNATFAAGSILDPYDLGGAATNVWHTVMTWEGTLTGAPTLSVDAVNAGWQSQISGNNLQVLLIPEPTTALLGGLGLLGLGLRRRRS